MTTQNSALAARLSRQKRLDGAFVWTTKLSALLVLLTLGGIMLSLVFGAMPSIREFGLNFIPAVTGIQSLVSSVHWHQFMAQSSPPLSRS